MARRKPVTREGFLTVHGVGEVKSEQYGKAFMDIVRECL
jgi:superfamily II DNA helicase RecQ